MKMKKLISIPGAIVLTTVAVFVGRASARFRGEPATNLFYTNGGVCKGISLSGGFFSGSELLTTGGSGSPAYLEVGGHSYALFNTSSCGFESRIHGSNL